MRDCKIFYDINVTDAVRCSRSRTLAQQVLHSVQVPPGLCASRTINLPELLLQRRFLKGFNYGPTKPPPGRMQVSQGVQMWSTSVS